VQQHRHSGADAGALASIGAVGDSYDNAMAESVIGLYKTECVSHDGPVRGVDDLELAALSWVYWFNNDRLYSSIGYQTPIEHEDEYSVKTGPTATAAGRTRLPLNPG
jgi:putative transposase